MNFRTPQSRLSVGLFGTIPFILLIVYGLRWMDRYREMIHVFTEPFVLRAISIIATILIDSPTESYIAVKVSPISAAYFFYVLAIDRTNHMRKTGRNA